MMQRIALFWRTIRYLRVRQLMYQVWNRLRPKPTLRTPKVVPDALWLAAPPADKPVSWCDNSFTFLNQTVTFNSEIDWNYAVNGKLWTYNLNYFDFLNQPRMPAEMGLLLIRDYIKQTASLCDGLEPYPTSLRIMNWAQFLSRHRINDLSINAHLFAQIDLLSRRPEYHLEGNHLLENGFALLIGALYFQQRGWFRTASRLLRKQLAMQIVKDGGHDERSLMYHQILLDRLLNVYLAVSHDTWCNDSKFTECLSHKAAIMLGWHNAITFTNGDVPMVNDAAWDIAPTTAQLRTKAQQVGIVPTPVTLNESGYRMFRHGRCELFVDVGAIGPDHQPGHAHADTFSFVLYVDGQPVLVDPGTSTYQSGERRQWERSTAAHNTVAWWYAAPRWDNPRATFGQLIDSSEVWASFRVGRRARVTITEESSSKLSARHDGYQRFGVVHERSWQLQQPNQFLIKDGLYSAGRSKPAGVFHLHFNTGIMPSIRGKTILAGTLQIDFNSEKLGEITIKDYRLATGFNQLQPARCVAVSFVGELQTTVTIIE